MHLETLDFLSNLVISDMIEAKFLIKRYATPLNICISLRGGGGGGGVLNFFWGLHLFRPLFFAFFDPF